MRKEFEAQTPLDAAAAGTGLISSFQRVVSLPAGTAVGYEALARWPQLQDLNPMSVFARAEALGKIDHLDQLSATTAARCALAGPAQPGMLLLINCEPTTDYRRLATDPCLAEAAESFHLVFEITERGVLDRPAALLRKAAALRSLGSGIALDDVGANVESLALLDILEPEIIKIDMGLIQRQPGRVQARMVAAIIAHHERTGAVILAEGIESEAHLQQALAYGATLGQGYRFGHPGRLGCMLDSHPFPQKRLPSSPQPRGSLFDQVCNGLQTRQVRVKTLVELSRHVERLALLAESPPIVLVAIQKNYPISAPTRLVYQTIAEKSPLTAVFGEQPPDCSGTEVKRVTLDPSDPLCAEWSLVVIGPDTAAAVFAREHVDEGAVRGSRRFDMVITFDRERVARAARPLLDRMP